MTIMIQSLRVSDSKEPIGVTPKAGPERMWSPE